MTSQIENDAAGEEIQARFDRLKHPESNRLMSQCDELINKFENQLLQRSPETSIFDFLCRHR